MNVKEKVLIYRTMYKKVRKKIAFSLYQDIEKMIESEVDKSVCEIYENVWYKWHEQENENCSLDSSQVSS